MWVTVHFSFTFWEVMLAFLLIASEFIIFCTNQIQLSQPFYLGIWKYILMHCLMNSFFLREKSKEKSNDTENVIYWKLLCKNALIRICGVTVSSLVCFWAYDNCKNNYSKMKINFQIVLDKLDRLTAPLKTIVGTSKRDDLKYCHRAFLAVHIAGIIRLILCQVSNSTIY